MTCTGFWVLGQTGYRTLIILALACLIPMAPLLLTMMPLDEVVKMLFKEML